MYRAFLILLAVGALMLTGCPEHKSKEIVEFERTWLKDYVEQNHKRVNGVLLDATVELKGEEVLIHWTLDYDGPRPPLTILTPMCPDLNPIPSGAPLPDTSHIHSDTEVRVIVPYASKVQFVTLWPPKDRGHGFRGEPRAAAFMSVEGKQAKGTIRIPLHLVKKRIIEELTIEQPAELPRDLYFGVIHSPTSRGTHYDLDAWTIDLITNEGLHTVPQRIVVKKW